METKILNENDINEASRLISTGELVAVPTETVYGLACNGLDEEAVERVYEVKGRPEVKPLSLMIHKSAPVTRYCAGVPRQARVLMKKFWPGPLTIVLRSKDIVPEIVRAGGKTVALRCPDHPLTQAILKKSKLPFAAPSANPSGESSPITAQAVLGYFDGKIAAVVDGGECGIGRESTIIDMSGTPFRILRQGALPGETIGAALAEELTVIGITGGTGCGKTTALRELERMGALVIDCDALYHEMLETNAQMLSEIDGAFPGTVIDGELQRKALGATVFSNEAALTTLNEITHRYICREVEKRLGQWALQGGKLAAVDAIALIDSGLGKRCRTVIGIIADKTIRIERIMKRDGISYEYALMRVAAQYPNEYFEQKCDHVLCNNGTQEQLKKECKKLFKEVLKNE